MSGVASRLDVKRSGLASALKSKLPLLVPFARTGERGERTEQDRQFEWFHDALARTQEALEALHEAEELHRLLFEKVPHPRFVCDAQTLRFLAVNGAAVRLYGYSRNEFLQMKVTDLSAPDSFAPFHEYFQKLWARRLLGAERRDHEFRHRTKDGTVIDVKVDTALIPVRGRRVFLLMTEDVTQKRRAEQRMRAQQAVTRALAESSTLAEASPRIFQAIYENLSGDWGELWRVDTAANVVRCVEVWHPGTGAVVRDGAGHTRYDFCPRRRAGRHGLVA
jgi:PAS domain S-box-containing protein